MLLEITIKINFREKLIRRKLYTKLHIWGKAVVKNGQKARFKKLDRFVEEIIDGEIWTIMNEKMISNVTLNDSDNAKSKR